jgi:hypothetical protein
MYWDRTPGTGGRGPACDMCAAACGTWHGTACCCIAASWGVMHGWLYMRGLNVGQFFELLRN